MRFCHRNSGGKSASALVVFGVFLFGLSPALAGGGLGGGFDAPAQWVTGNGTAKASGSGSSQFYCDFGTFGATVSAAARAQGGSARSVTVSGNSQLNIESISGGDLSTVAGMNGAVFEKGGNLIAKSVSGSVVEINVNGKRSLVAQEIAAAYARATEFGASAAVTVEGSIVGGNGYSSSPVQSRKGTR